MTLPDRERLVITETETHELLEQLPLLRSKVDYIEAELRHRYRTGRKLEALGQLDEIEENVEGLEDVDRADL